MPNPDRVDQSHLLSEINDLLQAHCVYTPNSVNFVGVEKSPRGGSNPSVMTISVIEANSNPSPVSTASSSSTNASTAQYKVFNLSKQIYDYGIFSGVVSEYSMKQNTPSAFCQLVSMPFY
jgi:hypothetical protein